LSDREASKFSIALRSGDIAGILESNNKFFTYRIEVINFNAAYSSIATIIGIPDLNDKMLHPTKRLNQNVIEYK
jgi:hypothetical protein